MFLATYNLAQQNDVFSADDEDASLNVAVAVAHINPFDRVLQHQICCKKKEKKKEKKENDF